MTKTKTPEAIKPESFAAPPEAESPTPSKSEPTFTDATTSLAEADAKARSTAGDANQAKAARSTAAVGAIRAAWAEKIPPEDVRAKLKAAGVLKGTVSKIVTVLTAMHAKEITMGDVKSLNGAYNLVKSVHATLATTPGAGGLPTPPAAPAITTPEEALKLIIDTVRAEKDPVKALALAGEWITKITNGIMEAAKEAEDDEE